MRAQCARWVGVCSVVMCAMFGVQSFNRVHAATAPYSGTPVAIPGTIEAENFDNGGEGVAFHDTTAGNSGGQYRSTNVDIEAGSAGGYDIGWIAASEWLNYTVNVGAAGNYTVQLRVASPSGASLHLGFNTTSNVWKTVSIPATGGWQNWTTVSVPVTLGAGTQQMTILADTSGFNFDSVTITRDSSSTPAPSVISSPYSGTPISIPGTIEAENFDNGAEGVAYHDTTPDNTGGQYRTTNVDIEASTPGGYDVGWIAAGEWWNYTVNVTASGNYTAQFRVASPSGGTLHLKFSGATSVSTAVTIPATGGWQNWGTVSVPLTLGAGRQQVMILADTSGFNLDSVTITSGASTPATPSGTSSSYSGTPIPIPGTIEAENFDNGGEGVAYHDTTGGNTGGQYRSTNVDVEAAAAGGYDVGWIDAGEWLKYTTNVSAAGAYTVQLRIASASGATIHLAFDGASNVSKAVTLAATGGWQNWTTVSVPVTLAGGVQHMTLVADTAGFNIDKIIVGSGPASPPDTPPTSSGGTVLVSVTSPVSGTHFKAPATITFVASASTTAGTISSVQFFNGSTSLGTSTSAPYGGTWSNVSAGSYALTAVATNSAGTTTRSAAVNITVDPATTPTPPPAISGGLVQPSNLVYQGSFRVPHADTLKDSNGLGLDYGGTAVGFNPARNSLYMVGHDWDQRSAELAIPATLGTGTSASNWPQATALSSMTDALEGHLQDVAVNVGDKNTRVGGHLVYNGQLYVTSYVYYGASEAHVIYRRSPTLSASGTLQGGMAMAAPSPDIVSGYMGLVPAEWQSALGGPALIGNCCLSIISRTSYGPSVSTVNPAALTTGAAAPTSTLVYYPSNHTTLGNWGDAGAHPNGYNGTSEIRGVVFPNGTSSVLFFGRQGLGTYCYGEATACGDPVHNGKGDHAYPYAYYVWAYDAHDLAAVKAGTKQPWDIKPYAVWSLNLPNPSGDNKIGGATYDPATGRIYVVQQFGDGAYPAVHVYTIR